MSRPWFFLLSLSLLAPAPAFLTACQVGQEPDYARPLPEGAFGLRRVHSPARMPDLNEIASQLDEPAFQTALQRSRDWFETTSSRAHFPVGPISHPHVRASLYALAELGEHPAEEAAQRLREEFDVWESVGYDGRGTVFYTGYYSPIFEASDEREGPYQYPLYRRPDDLAADPVTGEVRGRALNGNRYEPYPTRAELEDSGELEGLELVYLPSRLDAYLIEVNGSARLEMTDGSTRYIGFAGTNGHDYTSIGQLLIQEGHLREHELSIDSLRAFFERNPEELEGYIRQNDRFIFFGDYTEDAWPAGSMGFRVTPMRTLATDKSIFPRGSAVFVDTDFPAGRGGTRRLQQLMLDQDTGGAIRAAGRGDIYVGVGEEAGAIAGRQAAEGRLFYLLLKPDRVERWFRRMQRAAAGRR